MSTKLRNGVLVGVVAVGAILGSGSAATAAVTTGTATGGLAGVATKLVYGQPDLNGYRRGSNAFTITNNGTEAVEFPTLTFTSNGRDDLIHAEASDCEHMRGSSTWVNCVLTPLAAGASRTVSLPWGTKSSGPGGTAEVSLTESSDASGTPVEGTESTVPWKVRFEKLTGTFSIKATPLTYGPLDEAGLSHGFTKVTVKNLSSATVQYPLVTFPSYDGTGTYAKWSGCTQIIQHTDNTACIEQPLAAGEQRTLKFWFESDFVPIWGFDGHVRVAAATDPSGTVIPNTAAGTSFPIPGTDD
ncbi:hypothetical protein [Actinoplanes regularis]|uniref:Uncharacterized protein n=1 Tax=Actinoplanes regularis TaxID=52697 RepID=A0A239G4Y0_9ACTN|nr:hypothetical protein [Actinoplanes regularis]GIE90440.1 hypothetical protein Are01nite_69200 [Actinoplanes regularis]SNS64386.1 hypothetical protein SAMN06264365_12034 [Actinoplanes regularis]